MNTRNTFEEYVLIHVIDNMRRWIRTRVMSTTALSQRASILALVLALVVAGVILASNGAISVLQPNPNTVSTTSGADRWEPSSAAGNTWATSWLDRSSGASYVSVWNGGWGPGVPLTAAGGTPFGLVDIYLSWDSSRGRFVYVGDRCIYVYRDLRLF